MLQVGDREEVVKPLHMSQIHFKLTFLLKWFCGSVISEKAANVGAVNSTSTGYNGGRECSKDGLSAYHGPGKKSF